MWTHQTSGWWWWWCAHTEMRNSHRFFSQRSFMYLFIAAFSRRICLATPRLTPRGRTGPPFCVTSCNNCALHIYILLLRTGLAEMGSSGHHLLWLSLIWIQNAKDVVIRVDISNDSRWFDRLIMGAVTVITVYNKRTFEFILCSRQCRGQGVWAS